MARTDWDETHSVVARDGARLALYRFARHGSPHVPVLLTHGTFSDARICTRFAAHLRDAGFDAWVFEWREHGRSGGGAATLDYEDLAGHDVPAAVAAVLQRTSSRSLTFVGHSAGGVLPWMYLARNPAAAGQFSGIVSLASQTTHAGSSLVGKVALLGVGLAVTVAGRASSRVFRLGPSDESRPLMSQWVRWNVTGRWIGKGGFDYLAALGAVPVPALVLCGGGDRAIAPEAGCRTLFDALGGAGKTFVRCARSEGFAEDYDHKRIIASRGAESEIWPRVATWLRERSPAAAAR